MYNLKGFIIFPTMIDNVAGKVAPLGEISKDSLTYAQETGVYKDHDFKRPILYSFLSQDSDEGDITVPEEYSRSVLALGQFTYEQAHDGKLTTNRTQTLYNYEMEFDDRLENIMLGDMVSNDDDVWMPEWISFSFKDTQSTVRIWFSDDSFSRQYDDYEYLFIPPIPNIDDFFLERPRVTGLLAENSVKRIVEKIDAVRGDNPYTLLYTEEYKWRDEVSTDWTVMIYGRYGNDPDKIRLALIDWILANSEHTRDEWLEIFPDIFTPTEFILVPFWHRFAIPNQTIQAGLNSPTITLGDALEIAETFSTGIGYKSKDLPKNTTLASTPYRTLGFIAVASEANRNGVTDFLQLYPDYIGLPTSSRDFARLSNATQKWIYMFLDLLKVGEKMTKYNPIPSGYSRIIRDGKVYATKEHDGMVYLLAARKSVINTMGVEGPYDPEYPDDDGSASDDEKLLRDHLLDENPHETFSDGVDLDNVENEDFMVMGSVFPAIEQQ